MQLKLNNLSSYANDKILTRFSTFTQDEKYAFFADFYNLKKEADWTVMNVQYARNVNGSVQQYTLVDIWKDEIFVTTKFSKGDFNFLYSFNRFNYTTSEIVKLKEIKEINGKWVGGHFGPDLFDNNKLIYAFLDDSKITEVKQYGNRTYKRVRNGIKMRKNGYVNPNPSTFNGVHVKNKVLHTWVEGMSSREFLEEVSYVHSKGADIPFDSNGRKIISSHFTDGCPVKLVVESEITINGIKYYNYTTTILLNPKF
ncbi:hypothetical protein [Flavobacterium acetivorans]|uniref:hypothetical protein n=1 Tax=Flavobacterium acetivorans TaxID=2893883 RepID=UPI001E4A7F36|nr:hypothetical protein [Flavobacterium sp. F-29]UFH35076.1 hypothetical protein LNP19_13435 [Flavobacterium sp. F-29]